MKIAGYVFIGLIFLTGCNEHDDSKYVPGKIISNINYVGSTALKGLKVSQSDTIYTQFGDYITSITPTVFKAKFTSIRFVDELNVVNQMELINNNLPYSDPLRYADFTNNTAVTLNVELNGNLANEGASFAQSVIFKYFYFRLEYFKQEINLPIQYSTIVTLDQFPFSTDTADWAQLAGSLTNNTLTAKYRPLLLPLFPGAHLQRLPDAFVFGGTNSTFVLNINSDPHDFPNNLPYDGDYVVRSNLYNILIYTPPSDQSETTYINTTMTFNYNKLIQVYAGNDNIPYTKDDIFVYAPNFWERLSVNVTFE